MASAVKDLQECAERGIVVASDLIAALNQVNRHIAETYGTADKAPQQVRDALGRAYDEIGKIGELSE